MVDVVQACQKVFNETFAESRHRKNILGRMFSLREAEVGKMPEVAEGSLFDCQVETIKTVVLILLVSAFVLYMHSPNVFQCASISVNCQTNGNEENSDGYPLFSGSNFSTELLSTL